MKRILVVLTLLSVISLSYADWPVGVEAGAGFVLQSNNNHLFINGSALVKVINNLYIRGQIAKICFEGGDIYIDAGTLTPVDLLMFFPSETFNPYAIGGINFSTGGGYTEWALRAGGGLEFKLNEARFYPFVEAILDLYDSNRSDLHNAVTLKGGIRIK